MSQLITKTQMFVIFSLIFTFGFIWINMRIFNTLIACCLFVASIASWIVIFIRYLNAEGLILKDDFVFINLKMDELYCTYSSRKIGFFPFSAFENKKYLVTSYSLFDFSNFWYSGYQLDITLYDLSFSELKFVSCVQQFIDYYMQNSFFFLKELDSLQILVDQFLNELELNMDGYVTSLHSNNVSEQFYYDQITFELETFERFFQNSLRVTQKVDHKFTRILFEFIN